VRVLLQSTEQKLLGCVSVVASTKYYYPTTNNYHHDN
jgi:hypothetical protein